MRKSFYFLIVSVLITTSCTSKKKSEDETKKTESSVENAKSTIEGEKAQENAAKINSKQMPAKKIPSREYRRLVKLAQKGREKELLAETEKILSSNKNNISAIYVLAMMYYRKGKLGMAKSILQRAFAIVPKSERLYNSLGLIFLKEGKLEKSLSAFRKSLSINPSYRPALNNLADIYSAELDYRKSAETYEKIEKLGKLNGKQLSNYALSLWKTGKLDEAEKVYEKIYPQMKTASYYFNYLVFLTYMQKDYPKAKEVLVKINKSSDLKRYRSRVKLIGQYVIRKGK